MHIQLINTYTCTADCVFLVEDQKTVAPLQAQPKNGAPPKTKPNQKTVHHLNHNQKTVHPMPKNHFENRQSPSENTLYQLSVFTT